MRGPHDLAEVAAVAAVTTAHGTVERIAVTLMSSRLRDGGWIIGDPSEGVYTLRRSGGWWPARWPPPQIVVRPVGRRSWWHWAGPPVIAGTTIAPVSDADRTLRMLRGSLAKFADHADADAALDSAAAR